LQIDPLFQGVLQGDAIVCLVILCLGKSPKVCSKQITIAQSQQMAHGPHAAKLAMTTSNNIESNKVHASHLNNSTIHPIRIQNINILSLNIIIE